MTRLSPSASPMSILVAVLLFVFYSLTLANQASCRNHLYPPIQQQSNRLSVRAVDLPTATSAKNTSTSSNDSSQAQKFPFEVIPAPPGYEEWVSPVVSV